MKSAEYWLRKIFLQLGGSVSGETSTPSTALVAGTSGGWDVYRNIAISVTGQVAKASAGQLGGFYIYNTDAVDNYVKIYDKATAPTQADTPVMTIPVPATGGATVSFPAGIEFTSGISVRAASGLADNSTGAPAASVVVNLLYK